MEKANRERRIESGGFGGGDGESKRRAEGGAHQTKRPILPAPCTPSYTRMPAGARPSRYAFLSFPCGAARKCSLFIVDTRIAYEATLYSTIHIRVQEFKEAPSTESQLSARSLLSYSYSHSDVFHELQHSIVSSLYRCYELTRELICASELI